MLKEIKKYLDEKDFYPKLLNYGEKYWDSNIGEELGSGQIVAKDDVGLIGPFLKKKRVWVCRSRKQTNCVKCPILEYCQFPAK